MSKIKDKYIDHSNNYRKLINELSKLNDNNEKLVIYTSKVVELIESNQKTLNDLLISLTKIVKI